MMLEMKALFDRRAAALATVSETETQLAELARAHVAAGGSSPTEIATLNEVRQACLLSNSDLIAHARRHVEILAEPEAEAAAAEAAAAAALNSSSEE